MTKIVLVKQKNSSNETKINNNIIKKIICILHKDS